MSAEKIERKDTRLNPIKVAVSKEYIARLKSSPFFVVVDYKGLKVIHFAELRKRLAKAGAEIHVVKNSIFQLAANETGVSTITGGLSGQLAAVTGQKDVALAAKILKKFQTEFDKPKIRFGYVGQQRMDAAELMVLADLPPLDQLRSNIIGLIQAPSAQLVRLLSTPARQLARVLQLKSEQKSEPEAAVAAAPVA